MASIIIQNMHNKKVEVSSAEASILHQLQREYIDWMHACGGKGRCTTCRAVVVSGMEHLSPLNDAEQRMVPRLLPNERLACQAKAHGDVCLSVPEGCKFPHISYSK